MAFTMIHENYNVSNLDTSIAFYREALGLHEVRRKNAADGSFTIVYMADATETFELELTWLRDHAGRAYELGENESHLCLRVEGDYDAVREYHRSRGFHLAFRTDDFEAAHAKHSQMGCVCFENKAMGIYFIEDPDGYWLEIVPTR